MPRTTFLDELSSVVGDALEANIAGSQEGAVFTPELLARHIVDDALSAWAALNPGRQRPDRVLDVSVGSGEFLVALLVASHNPEGGNRAWFSVSRAEWKRAWVGHRP